MNTKLTPTEKRKAESLLHKKIDEAISALAFRFTTSVKEDKIPEPPKKVLELGKKLERQEKELKKLTAERDATKTELHELGWQNRYRNVYPASKIELVPTTVSLKLADGFSKPFLDSVGSYGQGWSIPQTSLDTARLTNEKVMALIAMKTEASERIFISGDAQSDYKDFVDKISAILR